MCVCVFFVRGVLPIIDFVSNFSASLTCMSLATKSCLDEILFEKNGIHDIHISDNDVLLDLGDYSLRQISFSGNIYHYQ